MISFAGRSMWCLIYKNCVLILDLRMNCSLQAMLLQSERLLVSIYTSSAQSADVHAKQFSEASQLNLEFNVLYAWLQDRLETNMGNVSDSRAWSRAWPLETGLRRTQRYYDLLWQDVYDSQEAWARMSESPDFISDSMYHQLLKEVAEVFQGLKIEWWPCRGTLIALLRHGARSGRLAGGKVDMVDRDIDVMLGVDSEEDFEQKGKLIEAELLSKGWDRCWTKSSVQAGHEFQFELRRDLLYCVHTDPYMMLDVTSYITFQVHDVPPSSPSHPYIFVHRVCENQKAEAAEAAEAVEHGLKNCPACPAAGTLHGKRCVVPRLGPLENAGGILAREAVYPLKSCWASTHSVPCPSKPLDTIIAMSHSGLSTSCIALPDTKGRSDDPFTKQLAQEGLSADDVQILKARARQLDSQGFQSMLPYFANCSHKAVAKVLQIVPKAEMLS